MRQNRKLKIRALHFLCHAILCIPLYVNANPFELGDVKKLMHKGMQGSALTPALMQEMKSLLTVHLGEWDKVKPVLTTLIQSESDLTEIIEALDNVPVLTTGLDEENRLAPPKQIKAEITKPVRPVRIGIHIASYKETKNIQRGWEILKHDFAAQLKGRVPLYYQVKINEMQYTRLVVGSFNSQSAALQVCKTLKSKGQYCQVTNYLITNENV